MQAPKKRMTISRNVFNIYPCSVVEILLNLTVSVSENPFAQDRRVLIERFCSTGAACVSGNHPI
jgi:hypothetical protein